MDHQLNQAPLGQFRHAFKSSVLEEIGQTKKIIGGAVSEAQNPIAPLSQGSVQNGPFTRPKGKISSHFLTARDHVTEEDVGTEMQMLMTINMRGWMLIEPLEFVRLRVIDMAKGFP